MSHLKLIKAPARRLLLTFVMTAGMSVAIKTASPQTPAMPIHGHRPAITVRQRLREQIDYSQIEGIQRWGLNE